MCFFLVYSSKATLRKVVFIIEIIYTDCKVLSIQKEFIVGLNRIGIEKLSNPLELYAFKLINSYEQCR